MAVCAEARGRVAIARRKNDGAVETAFLRGSGAGGLRLVRARGGCAIGLFCAAAYCWDAKGDISARLCCAERADLI